MTKTIRFFNQNGKWYADLPDFIAQGGTLEECEMVLGADTWLDIISEFGNEVTLKLSDTEMLEEVALLYGVRRDGPEFGADYVAHSYKGEIYDMMFWVCPVTIFVFGYYPDLIYYSKV